MPYGQTRRTILRRVSMLALGAAGAGGVASRAAAATSAPSASPDWRVAVVDRVRDGAVRVQGETRWLSLEGFPATWRAAVGDKVAVAPSLEAKGVSAQPLLHWISSAAAPANLQPGMRVGGATGPKVVGATILEPDLSAQRGRRDRTPRQLLVAVVDRVRSDGAERIFGIRGA